MSLDIVITGGAGHVGSYLVGPLLAQGNKVTVVDKLLFGVESLVAYMSHPNFRLIQADLTDKDLPMCLHKCDVIIHLAALVGGPQCKAYHVQHANETRVVPAFPAIKPSPSIIDINQRLPEVLAHSRRNGCFFIYASTCSVYWIAEGMADEMAVVDPKGIYASTKLAAEKAVVAAGGIVFRLGTIVGVSPRMRWDTLAHQLIAEATYDRVGVSITNGYYYRPFLTLPDLAFKLSRFLQRELSSHSKSIGQIYNVATTNIQKLALGERIVKMTATKMLVHTITQEDEKDVRNYQVSVAKLHELLKLDHVDGRMDGDAALTFELQKVAILAKRLKDPWAERYYNHQEGVKS